MNRSCWVGLNWLATVIQNELARRRNGHQHRQSLPAGRIGLLSAQRHHPGDGDGRRAIQSGRQRPIGSDRQFAQRSTLPSDSLRHSICPTRRIKVTSFPCPLFELVGLIGLIGFFPHFPHFLWELVCSFFSVSMCVFTRIIRIESRSARERQSWTFVSMIWSLHL